MTLLIKSLVSRRELAGEAASNLQSSLSPPTTRPTRYGSLLSGRWSITKYIQVDFWPRVPSWWWINSISSVLQTPLSFLCVRLPSSFLRSWLHSWPWCPCRSFKEFDDVLYRHGCNWSQEKEHIDDRNKALVQNSFVTRWNDDAVVVSVETPLQVTRSGTPLHIVIYIFWKFNLWFVLIR